MKKRIANVAAICFLSTLLQTFSSCESCSRDFKSFKSDIGGGLERSAVLMDYNGDTIKEWHGKFDIRDNGSDNQIFFDINGKHVLIQGGIFVSEEK